jgi:hypothetical protein
MGFEDHFWHDDMHADRAVIHKNIK